MTNPISKAIVKAAVAMGYGKKSDYKGSSVADVLEKFAAIAKDKGSSGGVGDEIKFTMDGGNFVLSEAMTMPELYNKVINGARIYATPTIPEQEGIIVHDYYMYFLH